MTRLFVADRARVILAVMLGSAAVASSSSPTLQQLPLQGWIANPAGVSVASADVTVRIYATAIGGAPVYDSGARFDDAVQQGRLDLVVGADGSLLLDDEAEAWLELQIDSDEVVGDAAAGRWRFRPGGGSHARDDIAARLAALEAALGAAAGAGGGTRTDVGPAAAPGAAATGFRQVHGLLALGRAAGAASGASVTANLLTQPVGRFLTATHLALLGPHYLLPREVLSTPVPDAVPARFALHPCRPNPFNPRTTVRYDLPVACRVDLVVFDVSGRRVRALRVGVVEAAGRHEVVWDGRDDSDRGLGSGLYLCRLTAGDFRATGSLTLVK